MMLIRVRIDIVSDDGDRLDVAAGGTRRGVPDPHRVRPGGPAMLERREPPLLDLKAAPVAEPVRRRWWQR